MAQPSTERLAGTHRRGVAGRTLWQRVAVWWRRRITWGRAVWRRLSMRAGVAHLVRAGERFSDRPSASTIARELGVVEPR